MSGLLAELMERWAFQTRSDSHVSYKHLQKNTHNLKEMSQDLLPNIKSQMLTIP